MTQETNFAESLRVLNLGLFSETTLCAMAQDAFSCVHNAMGLACDGAGDEPANNYYDLAMHYRETLFAILCVLDTMGWPSSVAKILKEDWENNFGPLNY